MWIELICSVQDGRLGQRADPTFWSLSLFTEHGQYRLDGALLVADLHQTATAYKPDTAYNILVCWQLRGKVLLKDDVKGDLLVAAGGGCGGEGMLGIQHNGLADVAIVCEAEHGGASFGNTDAIGSIHRCLDQLGIVSFGGNGQRATCSIRAGHEDATMEDDLLRTRCKGTKGDKADQCCEEGAEVHVRGVLVAFDGSKLALHKAEPKRA